MQRRSFFKSMFALPGMAGLTLVHSGRPVRADNALDAILKAVPREGNCYERSRWIRYGNWRIMWTGWKHSANSIDACGQWVSLPFVNGEIGSPDTDSRYAVYSACPGSAGTIERGECFDTSFNWSHVYGLDFMEAGFNADLELEAARRNGLRLLLEMLRGEDFRKSDDRQAPTASGMWGKLSPASRLFSDSTRYQRESGIPDNSEGLDEMIVRRYELLGVGAEGYRRVMRRRIFSRMRRNGLRGPVSAFRDARQELAQLPKPKISGTDGPIWRRVISRMATRSES